MCSIFKYNNCVGRNFDYDVSYDEELRIIRKGEHYSSFDIIGMCTGLVENEPLLYDGMNNEGLVCGALAFEGNAVYDEPKKDDKYSIPSWKFPLFILSNYKSIAEIKDDIGMFSINDMAYSDEMPPSDLHWFVADEESSIIIEKTGEGLNVYEYAEVMTNNPPYPEQKFVSDLMMDRIHPPSDLNVMNKYEKYKTRGMETYGLRGDYTSLSRFNRLTYLKDKLESSNKGYTFDDVSQSFHLLSSVEQIYGATPVNDKFEYTIYSIVYDMRNRYVYLKKYDELKIMECWL